MPAPARCAGRRARGRIGYIRAGRARFEPGRCHAHEEIRMQRWLTAVVVLFGLSSAAAGAPNAANAQHGGQVRAAGPYQLELLVDARELALYVTDHGDAPVDTAGGSVKAIITGGKNRYVVILSPAGGNVLRGAGDYKLGSYNLISLMLALPDQELQRAKFVHPKGAKPPPKKTRKKRKATKSTASEPPTTAQ
jgi:hypothetical protein